MSTETEPTSAEEQVASRPWQWADLLSAAMLAIATVATAWSGYQSAIWGGEQKGHDSAATVAIVKTGEFSNLAEQKFSRHAFLLAQWAEAISVDNTVLADLLFARFPEPLKTATIAWQETEPLSDPAAPASPFEMPEYMLTETVESLRWEEIAIAQYEAANRADEISDRYLQYTIIFASVLFFAGISGKFSWPPLNLMMLALGGLVLLAGLALLLTSPTQTGF
jgi:hypothetical protein